jgi:hypothetical protein
MAGVHVSDWKIAALYEPKTAVYAGHGCNVIAIV